LAPFSSDTVTPVSDNRLRPWRNCLDPAEPGRAVTRKPRYSKSVEGSELALGHEPKAIKSGKPTCWRGRPICNAGCIKAAPIAPDALQIVVREGQGWQACIPPAARCWRPGMTAFTGRLRSVACGSPRAMCSRIGRSSLAWGGWSTLQMPNCFAASNCNVLAKDSCG
jgi:hypothetical protein